MKDGLQEQQTTIDNLCVNTIRTLSMDAVQKANSGHPGAPMGLAAAAYVLWTKAMKHNPKNPNWHDRDRFVLSGGHASILLYILLHLAGYDVSMEDIKQFRQWESKTPGHPEYRHTPGVETTTGPLGQGFTNAVGMAMAERHLAARFNQQPGDVIVNHYTYVVCGEGDIMEGITHEAASWAGHLGLGKLICLYDENKITIEGSTDIAFTENVAQRFAAYGWQVLKVADANTDLDGIEQALNAAKAETQKPTIIILSTQIAYGSPNKQGTADAHGAPLGEKEIALTKARLGLPNKSFYVPDEVRDHFQKCVDRGVVAENAWKKGMRAYKMEFLKLYQQYINTLNGYLPRHWDKAVPVFKPGDPIATRAASGMVLNAIAEHVPTLMGGSADLAPSNKTYITSADEFQKDCYGGRNLRPGVREHALAAVMSGMFLHGGIRPYGGTFLVFADYMRPAIRMAAMMKLPLIFIFTHDSIAVGEDGPTHQPIEHLASLRTIPNLTVIRPADATETAEAWRQAIKTTDGPVALILSRQKLPVLNNDQSSQGVSKGAYILDDCDGKPDIILIATGSEVHICRKAKEILSEKGVAARVVSMPSWELFESNSTGYKNTV
ncbi:transketolase, partial [Bacteroidota bacterium]